MTAKNAAKPADFTQFLRKKELGEREREPSDRKVRDAVVGIAHEPKRLHQPFHRDMLERVVRADELENRPDKEAEVGGRGESELPARQEKNRPQPDRPHHLDAPHRPIGGVDALHNRHAHKRGGHPQIPLGATVRY